MSARTKEVLIIAGIALVLIGVAVTAYLGVETILHHQYGGAITTAEPPDDD